MADATQYGSYGNTQPAAAGYGSYGSYGSVDQNYSQASYTQPASTGYGQQQPAPAQPQQQPMWGAASNVAATPAATTYGQDQYGQQSQSYSSYQQPNSYSQGGPGMYGDRGGRGGFNNQGGPGGRGSYNKGPSEEMADTIFVSNLPEDVGEIQLAEHFGAIGLIKIDKKTGKNKIWIYKDKITGKGKGEATITYDDPPTANSAITWFHGKEFMGGKINVELAQRKTPFGGFGGGMGGRGGPRGGRGGPRGGGGPGGGRGGGPDNGMGGRDGDWKCPNPACGNNNFSWRVQCNRCSAPRDGPGGPGGPDNGPPGMRGGMRGGPRGGRGGDRGCRGGGPPMGGRGGGPPMGGGGPPMGGRGGGFGPGRGGPGRGGPMRGGPGGDRGDRRARPY
uniref:Putative rna-binding protein fus n=1 Tax=Rhipicephalus microplus TaxID=6941 RepID=A0A6M2CVH2_RHIMP